MSSTGSAAGSAASVDASSFDPSMALLTLSTPEMNYTLTVGELDDQINGNLDAVIVYASELGASLLMLVIVLLLTKPGKRSSPIFALNCLALLLNFIRLLFSCMYYVGPFYELYNTITNDYSRVPLYAYQSSIAGIVMLILLTVTIEISLVFQVQVVCLDLRTLQRRVISSISAIVALVAISFRLALGIANARYVWTSQDPMDFLWLQGADLNANATSIFFFSTIFVAKLAVALWNRHKMGLRRWGPIKILFIMGCQTLFIPAIFAILQYVPTGIPDIDSDMYTSVVLFLPLSALWASSDINNGSVNPASATMHPRSATWSNDSTLHASQSASEPLRKHTSSRLSPTSTELFSLDAALCADGTFGKEARPEVDFGCQAPAVTTDKAE